MNKQRSISAGRADGFILITSLLFLVIITLLAVSAIGSQTLQQNMANNLQERARALRAANDGLRHGELLIRQMIDRPAQLSVCYRQNDDVVERIDTCSADPDPEGDIFRVYKQTQHQFIGGKQSEDRLLSSQVWSKAGVMTFSPETGPQVDYFITYEPRAAANPAGSAGTYFFRITARVQRDDGRSVAVTRSVYNRF